MQSAMQENAAAQYELANAYRLGQGVSKDEKMALKWYKEAAYRNHPYAMNSLSYMYHKGLGMDAPDNEKADYWRKHAMQATDQAMRKKQKDNWKE